MQVYLQIVLLFAILFTYGSKGILAKEAPECLVSTLCGLAFRSQAGGQDVSLPFFAGSRNFRL